MACTGMYYIYSLYIKGNFKNARIILSDNKLTRFPAGVFKTVLEQMIEGAGRIYVAISTYLGHILKV